MPIVTFHLVEGVYPTSLLEELLRRASELYARELDSPIERVRAFAATCPPTHAAVAGTSCARGAAPAPYFEFLVLRGRPVRDRHALLSGFTNLVAEVLGLGHELIRGRAIQIDPDDWAIGGEPASAARRGEIEARRAASR